MRLTPPHRLVAVLRTLHRRRRALAAPILLLGILGAYGVVDAGREASGAVGAVGVAPAEDPTSPWAPGLWAPTTGDAGTAPAPPAPAPTAAAPPASAVPAPAPAATPGPARPAPPGPVVNQPPPRPNRAAPEPPEGSPPPAPRPGSAAAHPADFPDPFVLRVGTTYWAFATQSGDRNVPTMRSADLRHWTPVGDALAHLPAWSAPGLVWAPSVLERGATFVMYYTTRHAATGLQCISRAVSVLPQGPYVDHSREPLICQTARGGSIDPSPFVDDDGRPWLLWKSEGTRAGEPTRLWSQPLGDDGLGLLGQPTELLHQRLRWEAPIIEGPSMTRAGGRYHLFYSGNRWETAHYGIGHAVCASPAGPCRRTSQGPVLGTGPTQAGPGGQEVVRAPTGEPVLVHHAWEPGRVGYPQGARRLHLSTLHFDGDRVRVGGRWAPSVLGP